MFFFGLMISQGLLTNSPIYVGMLTSLFVVVVSMLTRPASGRDAEAWKERLAGPGGGANG